MGDTGLLGASVPVAFMEASPPRLGPPEHHTVITAAQSAVGDGHAPALRPKQHSRSHALWEISCTSHLYPWRVLPRSQCIPLI